VKRILISENQPYTLMGIRQPLGELYASVEITFATNSSQLLKCLESQPFDLLIVDVTEPDDDKTEIIESARITQPAIPVIICTGIETFSVDKPYADAGINGYISKSGSTEEVKHTIHAILQD
jgi:DNA-binding NarL/FixJ family response regulator